MAEITILRVSEAGKQAAKSFCLDASGNIQKSSFNAGTLFHYSQTTIEGIKELSDLLFCVAQDRRLLLIRGVLAGNKDPHQLVRRWGVKGHGEDGYFLPSPRGQPWILLDFDGIPCPDEIDFIKHPDQGVQYLTSLLPEYFHGVSYHYHLSSSAGMDEGKTIRAHIWYWLDRPVTEKELRIWAKSVNSMGNLIDPSLFQEVHPHYTADPLFTEVADPFPRNRSAFVMGSADIVAFPTISVPTSISSSNIEGLTPSEAFDKYLVAVGDHDGGMGFHKPLMMAAWYYLLDHGVEGTDKEALKAALKEAVHNADSSKHPDKSYIALQGSDNNLTSLIDGAIAKIGLKGKTGKIEGLAPHYPAHTALSVADAINQLSGLVRSYFTHPRTMGIRAGAGLGKTTKVVNKVRGEYLGKKVEFYVPTHALAEELAKSIKTKPNGLKLPFQKFAHSGSEVRVIGGRGQKTKAGEFFCLKNDVAEALGSLGLPIYPNLCQNKSLKCEYYGKCQYILQFGGHYDVRVFTHAHLGLDRGFLDNELPDYAIIDESYFQAQLVGTNLKEKPVSLAEIKAAPWPKELVDALLTAPKDAPLLSYLRDSLGEDVAIDCIQAAIGNVSATSDLGIISLISSKQLEAVSKLSAKSKLDSFLSVLREELATGRRECHGIQYQTENKKLKQTEGFALRYRRPITRFVGKKDGVTTIVPVLTIDADLTHLVHRQFFPDAEFHEIRTERNCHVIQCYSTKNSKTSLTIDGGAEDRIAELQTAITRIAMKQNVLVLGPETITGNPKSATPPKLSVPDKSALDHFGNIRGIDSYKDLSAIVVISQNNPPVNGIEGLARALWFDSEEPLELGLNRLVEEPRGYRTSTGYKVGVNVSVHPDIRVQTLLELVRESETLQGIDRLRLVHGSKEKLVVLFSNLVLDLTVHNLLRWDEMIEGTTKLNEAWRQVDGVLPLSDVWLAERFPDIFKTKDAAGSYLTRVGMQLGPLSNNISIKKATQLRIYTYIVSGQTGPPPKCLSKFGRVETGQRLEVLIGNAIKSITKIE